MDIAVVTGAPKGLGLEWCNQLAHLGYKVVLTARDLNKAKEAAEILNEQDLWCTQGNLMLPQKLIFKHYLIGAPRCLGK